MLSLKFPPLQNLLAKDTSELEPDDAKNGVCVKNNHAIIMMEQGILFFDLMDYFVVNHNFADDQSIQQLKNILDFMDGKMFSALFWKELTGTSIVTVNEEGLALDGMIRKDIYYKEKFFDDTEIMMFCKTVITDTDYKKSFTSVYMEPLISVITNLKTMIKKDVVVLRTVGENTPIHFTFDSNPWIFGIFSTDPAINSKAFLFENIKGFAESYTK